MEKIILLLTIILSLAQVYGELTPPVLTNKGPVRGSLLRTVQNSVEYSAFKGIPFAKPPVGYLRFRPPVEVDAWQVPLVTVDDSKWCPQYSTYNSTFIGTEDCLYLNVYTPKTNFTSTADKLLPAMVWIYGGGFYEGTVSSAVYGPDFLIEDDVVVVAMNYRLGALGFLNLNHPNATGNAGLKDQALALKWVQANIERFGGDPGKVTIFGQSAGGDSVELHKISDMSRGLFHRSIDMSGSALNFWSAESNKASEAKAFILGKKLGLTTTSKEILFRKLYNSTAEELVAAALAMTTSLDLPFMPTWEDPRIAGKDAFLTDCAEHNYKSQNYAALPHILGFTSDETIYVVANVSYSVLNPQSPSSGTAENSPPKTTSETVNKLVTSSLNFIGSEKITDTMRATIRISTDLAFVIGIDTTQRYLSNRAPIYYYRNSFDYDSSLHKIAGININGTGHSDDVAHIFWISNRNQSLDPTSDIAIHRKKMVRMWTNFAKYANPTPNGAADSILNVTWNPSGIEGNHLSIGNDGFTMKPRPIDLFVTVLQTFTRVMGETLNGCEPKY